MNDESLGILLPASTMVDLQMPGRMIQEVKDYWGEVITGHDRQVKSADGPVLSGRVVATYSSNLKSVGLRPMEPGVLGSDGVMIDESYRALISLQDNGDLSVESPVSSIEWITWLLQIRFLQNNATFLHCAGVEKDGQAILFPSWGGVGKTALAKGFVRDNGWKLLGDDLVILSADGECFAFPKPMVLYPYHRGVFPDVFESGHGPIAPTLANSTLTRAGVAIKPILRRMPAALAWARRHNPQSVRVSPVKVFGPGSIASQAQATTTVWLDRDVRIDKAAIRPADETFFSRLAGTTMNEFDRHCVSLTPLMCGLGIVSFDDLYGAWTDVLRKGLAGSSQWMLQIPAGMPVADVPETVMDLLASEGLFERTQP